MNRKQYAAQERRIVVGMMMAVGGMMGAYTYLVRGGVFCNAQTGNVLLMGIALGNGQWAKSLYYLIPFAAYLAGTFVSEWFRTGEGRWFSLKWTTCFTGAELLALMMMGWIPLQVPDQVVQVGINFLASIQYNSFRKTEGVPMATTFCTNHVRQMGIWMAEWTHTRSKTSRQRMLLHLTMLGCFLAGTAIVAALAPALKEHVIWVAGIPLAYVFAVLLQEDYHQQSAAPSCRPARHQPWRHWLHGCRMAAAGHFAAPHRHHF